MQGTCKFGFYEIFKNMYSNAMGEEGAYQNQVVLYLAASASAEFFADIALCPMEAVKVSFKHMHPAMQSTTLLRSESRLLTTLQPWEIVSHEWRLKREMEHSSKVWNHSGSDRFHTQWWNSPVSKRPLSLFMNMLYQNQEINAQR